MLRSNKRIITQMFGKRLAPGHSIALGSPYTQKIHVSIFRYCEGDIKTHSFSILIGPSSLWHILEIDSSYVQNTVFRYPLDSM